MIEELMSQTLSIRSKRLFGGPVSKSNSLLVMASFARRAFVLAVLGLSAHAETFLVDASNGPGTDYTDLPQALQAAGQNDLILVRAGDYSPFTTSKGVRILGLEDNVVVSGRCVIQSLHSGRKFVLYRLELNEVEIRGCDGHVAIQLPGDQSRNLRGLEVSDSVDVRVSGINTWGDSSPFPATVSIIASEVELVGCERIMGEFGGFTVGADGRTAVLIDDESRVRISLTNIEGGSGSEGDFWGTDGGDGAPAVHVRGGSELTITGDGTQVIEGGWAGHSPGNGSSEGGYALLVEESSQVRVSGVTLEGGWGSHHDASDLHVERGSAIEEPTLADPTMGFVGDPIPGQPLTMRVTGPQGGNVRYLLGRIPEISYIGGSVGPDLLVEIRVVNPGVIPVSGVRDYTFVIPPNIPQGMYFLGQASVVYQGTAYRTASQVLLVQ